MGGSMSIIVPGIYVGGISSAKSEAQLDENRITHICSALHYPLTVLMQCRAPSSEGDVADAMQRLHNNEAPREDGIPTEIYKACVNNLVPWLHDVIEQVWRDDVVPNDLGSGILLTVF
ncbi:unnamed protein product [Schistocephalus solidus]|uniref:UPF0029 domain-containing protein n=1 Tax=Schistocephalus solidus TaxID=70667 RepID=A0A183SPL8_SCHSO|nr:unnamed protein product [Schistocephalus solidus]